MLGRKIVQFVKVGLLVDMDEDTLSAAVEGIFAGELLKKFEALMEAIREEEEPEEEGELENDYQG